MTLPCQLDLCFARNAAGRTILAERRASYPYSITAPIMRADGAAQLTLQSISGGLYGGEHVAQAIRVRAGASVRLLQPAATTVRRKAQAGPARQSIALTAEAGARLVYATRPLIMLPGAVLRQDWSITLSPGARVMIWDGFVSHSPQGAAADWHLTSRLTARTPEGKILAAERVAVAGLSLDRFTAFGKIWCLGATPGPFEQALDGLANLRLGLTRLPGHAGFTIALAATDGGALCAGMERIMEALPKTTPQAAA